MECPHLEEHVKVGFNQFTEDKIEWKCAECKSSQQPWMCLYCGAVNCSRYVCGHALSHSETNSDHNVCIDCESSAVYCYRCDDYVVNDTKDGHLSRLKKILIRVEREVEEAEAAVAAAEAAAHHNEHETDWHRHNQDSIGGVTIHHNLRPRTRKRSHSNDSSSTNSGDGNSCPGNGLLKKSRQKKKSSSGDNNQAKRLANNGSFVVTNGQTRPNCNTSSPSGKREKKVVGLRNLGNTCFMNAVLQSLSNIEEFCHYFKQLPSLDGIIKTNGTRTTRSLYQSRTIRELSEAVVTEELRKVLISLSEGQSTKGAISPESLFLVIWKVVPRYRGYQQQDAHEFLRYMLDRLHTELLHLLPSLPADISQRSKTSVVTSVFGGTLQSEVRCLNCGTESKKHDPFLDLSLDIPEKCSPVRVTRSQSSGLKESGNPSSNNINPQQQFGGADSVDCPVQHPPAASQQPPPCHIIDCLTSFVEVEELAETELYYCNNCKSKQRSTKRFWIRRLPNVLCLHLKRFRWNNFFRTKVDTEIAFPTIALDMSQFVLSESDEEDSPAGDEEVDEFSDSAKLDIQMDNHCNSGEQIKRKQSKQSSSCTNLYDLAAVIVHHGGGSGSGHYTAFAINDGQWFHFNDSTVRPTDSEIVAKCKPYIMFYIRRELNLPSSVNGKSSSDRSLTTAASATDEPASVSPTPQ